MMLRVPKLQRRQKLLSRLRSSAPTPKTCIILLSIRHPALDIIPQPLIFQSSADQGTVLDMRRLQNFVGSTSYD